MNCKLGLRAYLGERAEGLEVVPDVGEVDGHEVLVDCAGGAWAVEVAVELVERVSVAVGGAAAVCVWVWVLPL
eukprot:3897603-Rhodomonas_salina.1